MADALRHQSSDVPNFDTYPATAGSTPATPGATERLLPETASEAHFGSILEERAYRLGEVAGRAMVQIRELRRRIGARAREMNSDASQKLSDVTETAQSKLEDLKGQAQSRAEDWKQVARERIGFARRQVRHNVSRARVRMGELKQDRPVEVALAAGAAGVVVGAALRIWRASRA